MKPLWLLPLLTLAGCVEDPHLPFAADFGNSVATNIAAQVVNPTPHPEGPATTDGKRMSDAMNRYRAGKVYPPIPPIDAVVKEGAPPDQSNFPPGGNGPAQ
jgi:type IV pilus biogenesis protein CpaD/CtpE